VGITARFLDVGTTSMDAKIFDAHKNIFYEENPA
jgi:hypothetical protein